VIEVVNVGVWLAVVLVFVVVPALSRPGILRAIARLAEYSRDWSDARTARMTPVDEEQESLRLWSRRCRLGAALDRIEHLLATDEWMSATRQMGNRLAYNQLVVELSRMPDAFPPRPSTSHLDVWADPYPSRRRRSSGPDRWDDKQSAPAWSAAVPAANPSRPGQVEVLDIGWRG
jgi:hypothetical protein